MDLYKEKNIKPMLLSEIDKPFNDKNYLFEMKFDGSRTIIYVTPKEIKIKNKRGIILNDTYPELLCIKDIVNKKCIFDGEIVLMKDGVPSFDKLQERALLKDKIKINYFKENYPVTFVCFDILYEDENLIDLPLMDRIKILSKYPDTNFFVKSRVVEEDGINLYNTIKKLGIEGIVAKHKESKYVPNVRSKDWIKIKNWKESDYYICGYKEEEKVASILLGEKVGNKLIFISKVTLGKKRNDFKLIKKCKVIKNKFYNFKDENYTYIDPKYKCTISYIEKTKNNHLRQPVFKGIKID